MTGGERDQRPEADSQRDRDASPAGAEVSYPGSEILAGKSPREILHRLVDGDPLHIAERSWKVLSEMALLLNPERYAHLSMARTAHAAPGYAGDPPLGEWLDGCARRAASDMLNDQWAEEHRGMPVSESPDAEFYAELARLAHVELELARLVCLTVNNLPDDQRRVFVAIVVEGKTIHRYVAGGNGPPDRVKDLLGKASRAVFLALRDARRQNEGRDGDV